MNVLASKVCSILVSNSFLKNGGLVSRSAAFKSDLKIKWIRPEKISCIDPRKSGDGGLDLEVTQDSYLFRYNNSKQLQDTNEIVKKMLTLEYMPKKMMRKMKLKETVALVQRHKTDHASMESTIATMTAEILHLQEHMKTHKSNSTTKVYLKELIDKRKKFLTKLRVWDYKRFEWILEKLNLVYKPNLDKPHKVTRKASMRKLTKLHCYKLKSEKRRKHQEELEKQQPDFFIEKAKMLEFVRNEEIACGKDPTVTEEEIEAAKKIAEEYKNHEKSQKNDL